MFRLICRLLGSHKWLATGWHQSLDPGWSRHRMCERCGFTESQHVERELKPLDVW